MAAGQQGREILDHGEEPEPDSIVPGDLGAKLVDLFNLVVEGLLESLGTVLEENLGGRLEHVELFSFLGSFHDVVLGDDHLLKALLKSLLQLGDVVEVSQVHHDEDLVHRQILNGGRLVVEVIANQSEGLERSGDLDFLVSLVGKVSGAAELDPEDGTVVGEDELVAMDLALQLLLPVVDHEGDVVGDSGGDRGELGGVVDRETPFFAKVSTRKGLITPRGYTFCFGVKTMLLK